MGSLISSAASNTATVLGNYADGQNAKKWGKYQNKQAKADASATIGAAKVEQQKIREQVASQVSSAVSGIANSGAVVGDGTAGDITKRINSRGEYDAQMTMYNAQDRANRIMVEGQAAKLQGERSANLAIMGSLLGMGEIYKGGQNQWKTTDNATPQSKGLIKRSSQGFGFMNNSLSSGNASNNSDSSSSIFASMGNWFK